MSFPKHIAVIMDGNGRWARARGLIRTRGHEAASKRVRELVKHCIQYQIEALSLFAFSSENWNRPKLEVRALMHLFLKHLNSELPELHAQGVQIKVVGDVSKLNTKLQKAISEAENLTIHNNRLKLRLAISYGGRWEITQAVKSISESVSSGEMTLDDITEELMNARCCFGDLPDPDLLIRTSGEQRISNFMLWSLAYAELYFASCFFPDFDESEFLKALDYFGSRERRFGRTS